MLLKKIYYSVVFSLIFISVQASGDPIVSQEEAEKYVVEKVGKDGVTSLIEKLDKLLANPNGIVFSSDDQHCLSAITGEFTSNAQDCLVNAITTELSSMIFKAIGFVGVAVASDQVAEVVKPLFLTLVRQTNSHSLYSNISNPSWKGVGTFSRGIIINLIQDLVKNTVKSLVYKSSEKNRHLKAGAAVALVEQLFIYSLNYGQPVAILAAEAELLATRIWEVGTELFELHTINKSVESSRLNGRLLDLQLEYTKKFSSSESDKENAVKADLGLKFNELRNDYSENHWDAINGFEDNMYQRMQMHKISYRYIYINQENLSEVKYTKYINSYFPPSERWYYHRVYSSENKIYSDVEVNTDLHQKLYSLTLDYNIKYPNIDDGSRFNPSKNISGSEYINWLTIIEHYLESTDDDIYAHDYKTILSDFGGRETSFLTRNTTAQITDKFYQNIYGSNYASCLLKPPLKAKNTFSVEKRINIYLTEKYGSGRVNSLVKKSIINYFTLAGIRLYGHAVFNLENSNLDGSSIYLDYKINRGLVVEIVYDLLKNHKPNKNMMAHCSHVAAQEVTQ